MLRKTALPGRVVLLLLVVAGAFLVFCIRSSRPTTAQGAGNGRAVANGDVDGSGEVNITDAVYLLEWLFLGGPVPVTIIPQSGPPATGQTLCHDALGNEIACGTSEYPGEDGQYQAGCAGLKGGRFVDNQDGTVTDLCTGLMWQQTSGQDLGKPWQETLQQSEALILCMDGAWTTDAQEASVHGGVKYDDWRLPNARELETLLDYGTVSPACTPLLNVQAAGHWTSTSYAGDPTQAWCIHLYGGEARSISKEAKLKLIVVREGN